MIVTCGDANPGGNVALEYKGGCGEELEMKDAYRCAGCGGWFHLDCLKKHFELEKDHDYHRQELRDQVERCKEQMTEEQLIKAGF